MAYVDPLVTAVSGIVAAHLGATCKSVLRAPMTQPDAAAQFPALVVYRESEEPTITGGGELLRDVSLSIGYYLGITSASDHEEAVSLIPIAVGKILLALKQRRHASYALGVRLEDILPGTRYVAPGGVVYELALPDAGEEGSYPAARVTARVLYDDTTWGDSDALLHITAYLNHHTRFPVSRYTGGTALTTKID